MGSGLYKLNNSILDYPHVITELNTTWDNWRMRKPEYVDLLTWWDHGKLVLKNKLIELSSEIPRIRKQKYIENKESLEYLTKTMT